MKYTMADTLPLSLDFVKVRIVGNNMDPEPRKLSPVQETRTIGKSRRNIIVNSLENVTLA
ncbi:MAG: hypothetical protein CMJ81_16880 [Planctomycetaceae bacterium]|jgi:hypothetical protein|nr:hypothetical protein [Planctomycetaceae bacterium]MBP63332.1 hypothetical protein [Planctomycetaceae bacterium]